MGRITEGGYWLLFSCSFASVQDIAVIEPTENSTAQLTLMLHGKLSSKLTAIEPLLS